MPKSWNVFGLSESRVLVQFNCDRASPKGSRIGELPSVLDLGKQPMYPPEIPTQDFTSNTEQARLRTDIMLASCRDHRAHRLISALALSEPQKARHIYYP